MSWIRSGTAADVAAPDTSADDRTAREAQTGTLFHALFSAYDDPAFKRSVELFAARFDDAGFDTSWFRGKACLDAGCGGGRYSIALARLGAAQVVGVDLKEDLLADARRRADDLGAAQVAFQVSSVADLPFESASFDFVCLSGVLQHTADPVRVVRELARVLRPGGLIYLLVYATEGLRWPLVQILRPLAHLLGFAAMDGAIARAGMPVNRRRTYLDDLFVPYIDFYSWQSLEGLLSDAGFERIERWSRGRLDHEETLESYRCDLRGFLEVFEGVVPLAAAAGQPDAALVEHAVRICKAAVDHADAIAALVKDGALSNESGRALVIGQGHHRVLAWKR